MQDFIKTVSGNITELRKQHKLTQVEFGAKINYSDKSVSKWERGDSLPDLIVLKTMANAFDVPIEYFFSEHKENQKIPAETGFIKGNRIAVALLGISFVWLVASVTYVYTRIYNGLNLWTCFVWPVPISFFFLISVFRKAFGRDAQVYLRSLLIWTLLASIYVQFLDYNLWILFFIGVPLQAIVILLEVMRRHRQKSVSE